MHFVRKRNNRLFTLEEKCLVGCTFQVQKFRSDGTITYQGPVFSNMVLNSGLDLLASYRYTIGDNFSGEYINVGTDNTAPSETQTGLLSYLASTDTLYSTDAGYSSASPIHRWREAVFEFSIGSCTGNLTEVGLSESVNANYVNRQLFKDDAGDPTTITVLEDEGLRITVRGFFYSDIQPGDTVSGSFLLNDSDTIDTTRELTSDTQWLSDSENYSEQVLVNLTNLHSHLFRLTESGTDFDGGTTPSERTLKDYSTGDYYREAEATWLAGRFVGTINSVLFMIAVTDGDQYDDHPFSAFRLSPGIAVEDTEEFRMTFRRSWGRYAA